MKKSSLDALTKDYFKYKIADIQPQLKQNLWGFLFSYILLFLFVPTNYMGDIFPGYIKWSTIIWLCLCAVYIVSTIFFNPQKSNATTHTLLMMFSSTLFMLEFWLIVSQFSIMLCCSANDGTLDPIKTAIVSTLALLVLLGGILMNICVFFRVKRRIKEGHYRESGKGFWDSRKRKQSLLRILAVAAPVIMSFSTASIFISKFWSITWDNAYIPVIAVVAPLLVGALFAPFTYLNSICLLRIYYIKRFGVTLIKNV